MGGNSIDSKLGVPDRTVAAGDGLGKISGDIESPRINKDSAIHPGRSPGPDGARSILRASLPIALPHTAEIVGLFRVVGSEGGSGVTVDSTGRALIWSGQSGQPREVLSSGFETRAAAVSADGSLLALAGGLEVRIYGPGGAAPIHVLKDIRARAGALKFEPNGRTLVIGTTTGEIFRWNFNIAEDSSPLVKEKVLERYQRRSSVVSALSFHPSGRFFISGDWDGGVQAELLYEQDMYGGDYDKNLFGTRFFQSASTKQGGSAGDVRVNDIAASPDGAFLAVGLDDGVLELWSMRGFERRLSIEEAHRGSIFAVDISLDGARTLSIGRDGFLRIWTKNEALDGEWKFEKVFEGQVQGIRRAAFLTSSLVLTGGVDGAVQRVVVGD